MKYVCFGYFNSEKWGKAPAEEMNKMIDLCLAYDDQLKKNGHWVYGEGLQGPEAAMSLHHNNGKVTVTDGPYAETKEILGGLLIIEARDLNHAVQLISNHPGVQMGAWEIRPAQDLEPMIQESEKRRSAVKGGSSRGR